MERRFLHAYIFSYACPASFLYPSRRAKLVPIFGIAQGWSLPTRSQSLFFSAQRGRCGPDCVNGFYDAVQHLPVRLRRKARRNRIISVQQETA